MQDLQIPVTAESKVPPARIFAINHNQRDRLTSCLDAILVTPKKTCNIYSPNQSFHPNDQGLTLRSGRRVVLGRGQGSLASATAAGGRPPSPATAYQPKQTRPENLPWQRRTTHLIEIKYCEDDLSTPPWTAAPSCPCSALPPLTQHCKRQCSSCHSLRCREFYLHSSHLFPFKSLGLDSQRVKRLGLKLHAHSVHYAHKLVQTRRSLEHHPHLQTNQERSAGAFLPATLLLLTDCFLLFWWRGFSTQVAPFP